MIYKKSYKRKKDLLSFIASLTRYFLLWNVSVSKKVSNTHNYKETCFFFFFMNNWTFDILKHWNFPPILFYICLMGNTKSGHFLSLLIKCVHLLRSHVYTHICKNYKNDDVHSRSMTFVLKRKNTKIMFLTFIWNKNAK